jgi:hypothetical protein
VAIPTVPTRPAELRNPLGMAHHLGKTPRPSRMTVPDAANALCKIAFAEARRCNHTYDDLDYASGVQRGTIKAWRRGLTPRLFTVESVLGTVGWGLAALPHSSDLPAGLRRDLEAALAKFGHEIPALDYLPEVPVRVA